MISSIVKRSFEVSCFQAVSAALSSMLENTKRQVHNFVCKYFFEPWQAASEQVENQNKNGYILQAYREHIFYQDLKYKPKFYTSSPQGFSAEQIVEDTFEHPQSFSILQAFQPSLADPNVKKQIKSALTEMLKKGTCYAESLIALKLSSYFPLSGPMRESILSKYRFMIGFIQLSGLFRSKWSQSCAIIDAVRQEGSSIDRLVSKAGVIDEAQLFYYLSKVNPSCSARQIRLCIPCFLPEDFTSTQDVLAKNINRIDKVVSDFMESACKHSDLPQLPKRSWHPRQKIASSKIGEADFLKKTIEKTEQYLHERQGSFVLCAESESDAHAVFIKKERCGVILYDPMLKSWMLFDDPKRSIHSILQVLFASIHPELYVETSIDTLDPVLDQ